MTKSLLFIIIDQLLIPPAIPHYLFVGWKPVTFSKKNIMVSIFMFFIMMYFQKMLFMWNYLF